MDLTEWFDNQLTASAEGFAWAVEQIPPDRQVVTPPKGLGEWSVAHHVFHMYSYERMVALPTMRHWLGDPLPANAETYYQHEEAAWKENKLDVQSLLTKFREVRTEQLLLLPDFNLETWEEKRDTVWGSVALKWVVGKTYQHTCEHTNDVLQMALFWDQFVKRSGEG